MLKIKLVNLFKSIFNYYYIIINLHTFYRIKNIYFLFFLLLISIFSIFLRKDIFSEIHNPILLNIIIFSGIIYVIYIQYNLYCRLTFTFGKGLPYFLNEIKYKRIENIHSYFIGFLVYNILMLILSFLLIIRIYIFIYEYNELLFYVVFYYGIFASMLMYYKFITSYYRYTVFGMDPNKMQNIKLINYIISLVFPFLLLLNVFNLL